MRLTERELREARIRIHQRGEHDRIDWKCPLCLGAEYGLEDWPR
jgi:hypothetical protein